MKYIVKKMNDDFNEKLDEMVDDIFTRKYKSILKAEYKLSENFDTPISKEVEINNFRLFSGIDDSIEK